MGCKKPTQKKHNLKLKNHIMKHGHACWSSIPINAGIKIRVQISYATPSYIGVCCDELYM